MSLASFIDAMPKVELHVHLEGAIEPATLLDLAARRGVELPASDPEGLERWFRFRDFAHFVDIYVTCSRCLVQPEDFHRVACDFLAGQAAQGVLYSEVHFTISTHLAHGVDGAGVLDALEAAATEGRRRHGVSVAWIPDIVRNVPRERADATLEWALSGRGRGVVALGLSGHEEGYPAAPFAEHFRAAAAAGLRRVAHAGENGGPASVREALAVLGAERLGHGVRAAEDPALVDELARRGVPLEVCPTSNLRLGLFDSLAEHSFDTLYRAGVPLSVNSDDPPLFGTTLSDEYRRLAETFGYSADELAGLARGALEHSFLGEGERRRLRSLFETRLATLGTEHLGRPVEPAARHQRARGTG